MTDTSGRASLTDVLNRTYRGKRVFISGHNGFVGSWLTYVLLQAGAEVVGFSLTQYPGGIAEMLGFRSLCQSNDGDIRDLSALDAAFHAHAPDIVFHLAAQPLVLPSYENPIDTLSTNVMGTANVLETVRLQPNVAACVIITSDKCYATASHAHDESDPFGGDDIYSASKGAAEIIINAYRQSFFQRTGPPIASARAGNIVGGGDWAEYRIVPDVIRALQGGEPVCLRQPNAIRPWQHVLDAVAGYLRLGDALASRGIEDAEGWNFGPSPDATVSVGELVNALVSRWRHLGGEAKNPVLDTQTNIAEREYLTLISSKAEKRLHWTSLLSFDETMSWTTEWYFNADSPKEATAVTESQIARYLQFDASA